MPNWSMKLHHTDAPIDQPRTSARSIAEVVEQLLGVAGEPGDAVAVVRLRRHAVAALVDGDHAAAASPATWWRNIAWVWPQPCSMTSGIPSPPLSW